MTPQKKRGNKIRRLVVQLENDIKTSLNLAKEADEFAEKANQFQAESKNPYIYAVAMTLQHFYTSLETAFKRVTKELEGDIPSGESWHRDLLELMFLEIEGVRPPLLSSAIKDDLDKLRRFRHVVRHGYEYELDWSQMLPLIESLNKITKQIKEDFAEFKSFLLEIIDDL